MKKNMKIFMIRVGDRMRQYYFIKISKICFSAIFVSGGATVSNQMS